MTTKIFIIIIVVLCMFVIIACVPGMLLAEEESPTWTLQPSNTPRPPLPTATLPVPTSTATATPTPSVKTLSVSVPGDQCWIDSGVEIGAGDQVLLSATGSINTWGDKSGSNSDPDGQYKKTCGDVKCPLQGADYGALIGRVGKGDKFLVGTSMRFSAVADGNLYLTVNDWECSDNSGEFSVVISYGKELTLSPTPERQGSWNLALNQPVAASRGEAERPPKYAVDGNTSTDWGSGGPPPQWIEIDLGAPAKVGSVHLLVTQYPYGDTVHRILLRTVDGEFFEAHRFEQSTNTGDWLEFVPDEPLENIQAVRIETIKSPSWVGWLEIEVIGER